MKYEIMEHKFGSWAPYFKEFIESVEFDEIFRKLKGLKPRGRIACPSKEQTFRCFLETPYEKLKAIFVFNSAYSTIENNTIQADGLALSSSNTGNITPAIRRFYEGMGVDIVGDDFFESCSDPDLSYLANQGILLLNASLTVELHKPGSHFELWKPFMKFFFLEIVNRYSVGLPIVFFGSPSVSYAPLVLPFHHKVFKLDDPLKETEDNWRADGTFKMVDRIAQDTDPAFSGFKWLCEQPEFAF